MPVGVRPIVYNSALARSSLRVGSSVRVPLPDGANVMLNFEKSKRNASGSVTWVGQLAGSSKPYKAIITDDGEHVFGRIVTPEGEYLIRTVNGIQQLISPRAAGLATLPFANDEAVPPVRTSFSADQSVQKSTSVAESAEPTEMATVDVLLAYSSGLADELGSGLQTRLEYLIALTNQAYENSEIHQRARVVHTVEVDYSDTLTSNGGALNEITFPSGPPFAAVHDLRDTYGADLVAFIRQFHRAEQQSCGIAWVLGSGNRGTVSGSAAYGYSVVSDGSDGFYYCTDLTLAHELGHNMGSTHDRANTSTSPVFPYSYGHGYSELFGTVMSYINPEVAVFSNPDLNCDEQLPCGIAHPDPESADNARSINNTRFDVAAFRETVVPEPCTPENTLTLENTVASGTVTETACAIVAGPSYTVASAADVVFQANESITLRSGFRVEIGGQFAATAAPGLAP